jgi:hypothetical protein
MPDAFLIAWYKAEQRQQPLQAAVHRARRDRQAQGFRRPAIVPSADGGILVQQNLSHTEGPRRLGINLGRRRVRLAAHLQGQVA